MESAKVYFTNLRTTPSSNLLVKMERLVKRAGIEKIDFKNQFVAVKIHFGEPGNLAYIRPNYAAGTDYREVPLNGEYCKAPKIGTAIADADIVVSMNHFKGHEQSGFGGALKNLGMGSASVGGKLELHSASQPVINREACTGCGICVKYCAHDAIHLKDRKAIITYDKCVGCGQCVALCQYDGAIMGEGDTSERLNCKIAEYTQAVLLDKPHFHVNFIMNVSPECDCWNHNDAAIVPDLGILASFDPVAIDQASADLVIQAPILNGSILSEKYPHRHMDGEDKFKLTHPDTHWQAGLAHAEKIGLGTRTYEKITV